MELIEQAVLMEKDERTIKASDKDSLTVRFKLMSAETQNLNNRVYPRPVLAKAVEDLKSRIAKRRSSFATCGHKDDAEVDDVTAFLEDVEMVGNDVYATAKVMPTAKGKNVITLLRHGAAIGVSAKGRGEMDGNRVKPGFTLFGFDWTLEPGFGTFVGKSNIIESVTVEDDGAVTLEELEKFGLEEDGQAKIEEDILRQRYGNAVRLAGYKGTFEKYRETLNSKKG